MHKPSILRFCTLITPPSSITRARSRISRQWRVLAAFPSMLKSGSGTTNAQTLDFTILYLNYAALEHYSRAISNLAAVESSGRFSVHVEIWLRNNECTNPRFYDSVP